MEINLTNRYDFIKYITFIVGFSAIGVGIFPGVALAKTAERQATATVAPAGVSAPLARKDFIAYLHGEFNGLDLNKDGTVTKAELAAGLAVKQVRVVNEIRSRRSAAFDAMDTNHDGGLTRDEFLAAAANVPKLDDAVVMNKLDADHNGSLSFDEYSAPTLARFDQRKSGQVDKANQDGR